MEYFDLGVLCFTGTISLSHIWASSAARCLAPSATSLKPWPELNSRGSAPIPPKMLRPSACAPRLLYQLNSLRQKFDSLSSLQEARTSVTPSCQSISYSNTKPLAVMSGENCYLTSYESAGQHGIEATVYLDTRNNVPSVGHSNPVVVKAIAEQAELVNTNTRYLHPDFVELKQKIIQTLPDVPDDDWQVILTNSGSESNDLALRIAKCNTKSGDRGVVITTDIGYHGHTASLISVSPYKLKSIGETSPRKGTKWLKHPNTYTRGAQYYIEDVEETLKDTVEPVLIFEIGMSVGGVILPPEGYLGHLVNGVKTRGGTVIFDCVQTGCGRLGVGKWWGFEGSGVTPDIVTVGKPLGNGHPVSVVCVKRSVVKNFDEMGMEYFNTFGGNTVSVAAALATVNEMERLKLMENCTRIGGVLKAGFKKFMELHPNTIGDVRGEGLFLGVELIASSERDPGTSETSWVCSKMKDDFRVLTTIDGEHDSVIVVKPPQTFGDIEAEYFLWAFGQVLKKLEASKRYGSFKVGKKTPT
ncbi:hypothetical protein TrST_g7142 [Triparma strigata]|uniref:Uncharacterized protein n=1 Tax=Triparma strigata TaxID=1606541 RepID=A0A9W7B3Y8_9STRA|nr:hypothetical protein TrST_g7142 [Triparma strigata]